jgi:hypothetical protein
VAQDVPGATLTVNLGTTEVWLVTIAADINITAVGGGNSVVFALLDGANMGASAILGDAVLRATVGQVLRTGAALGPGAHTVKLQANKGGAGGTVTLQSARATLIRIPFVTPALLGEPEVRPA